MIAFLRGRVAARTGAFCLLDVDGVGYRVFMPTSALADLPGEGELVTVLTHLQVREDDWSLYGFLEEADRELFELLISISGVGPKVALSALSALGPDALVAAIAAEDVPAVSSVPGVGKKTAQRIIVELKDKLGTAGIAPAVPGRTAVATPAHAEARDALLAMGFASAEAAAALQGADGASAAELVRQALRKLGGAA